MMALRGGLQYGAGFGTDLSTVSTYLDALEPLTPSTSIKTDLASRILGLRVDEYLGSDTFTKRLTDNLHTVIYLAAVAQIGILALDRASPPKAGAGGLVDETWNADLVMLKTLIGLALKEKLKAPGVFDTGGLLTPTHPLYASDSYFGGTLPSGLNVDAAKGEAGQGDLLHLGTTLNLGKLAGGKTELDEPTRYRGWQAAVWGDYQHLLPTPQLEAQGRVPDRRFRAGALYGKDGLFVLGEGGGHFSGADAGTLTSKFFSGGIAYVPAGGVLKKIGFKLTQIGWDAADSLRPAGTTQGGSATRVTPFASFDVGLGSGGKLAFGGSAGLTSSTEKPLDLSDWRGDISYTYLGQDGTTDLPAFRIELSGSGTRVDYFDPASPTLYGIRGKLQLGSTFVGAQANFGGDKVPTARAEALRDPHGDPASQPADGNSVLFVVGVLR